MVKNLTEPYPNIFKSRVNKEEQNGCIHFNNLHTCVQLEEVSATAYSSSKYGWWDEKLADLSTTLGLPVFWASKEQPGLIASEAAE